MGRVIRQSVQFVMTILNSKNVKYFWFKPWKTEVRYYIRRSYTMDALVISPKNTMQSFVPMCKVCIGRYPTILHANNEDTDTKEDKLEEVKCASTNTEWVVINMCIVPVQINQQIQAKRFTLMLNSCSQGTFILYWLANDLGISGRNTSLTIKTLNGEFTSNSTALEGLKVACISEVNSEWLPCLRSFTRPDLPVDSDDITKPSQLRKWKMSQISWLLVMIFL